MCVIFWAEEGEFEIPHVFEVLRFELPRRRVLANISAIISASDEHEQVVVGVAHRRRVEVEPAFDRWEKYARKEEDWVASVIGALYGIVPDLEEGLTLKFGPGQVRNGAGKMIVPSTVEGFGVVEVGHEEEEYATGTERYKPFTPFVFELAKGASHALYSFDITVEGTAFDSLVDVETGCSVDGAAILKSKILNEDLQICRDTSWKRYFEEHICDRIVKPKRYDTMITNGLGALPTCYRLCNRTRRELVDDEDLSSRVAWFTSDDPNQDFIIELEFVNERVGSGDELGRW